MSGRFEGKVVVVTGGSSGIGLATAQHFAAEGASVVMTGRRQAVLDEAVKLVGHGVVGVTADMANLADIDRLYAVVKERFGHIDVVFANAGGGSFAPLGAITEEHYDSIFATNVKGVLFSVQKALPLMPDGGSVIITSSTTGTIGTPAFSVYSATKAAVRNFARSWSLDLKDRHIRVNVISPGLTETPGVNELFGGGDQAESAKAGIAAGIPSGRVGHPDEIAEAVLFLASSAASYVNGAELFVDGGMAQI